MKKSQKCETARQKTSTNSEKTQIISTSSPENSQRTKRNIFRTKAIYGKSSLQNKKHHLSEGVSYSPKRSRKMFQEIIEPEICFTEKIDAWNFNFEEDDLYLMHKSVGNDK